MKTNRLLLILILLFLCSAANYAQSFSQEIGVIAGPVAMRSDYGLRGNSETNFSNTGLGVGLVHYINFAFRADCNCYSRDKYFNDHFKIRTEFDYHITRLDHFGKKPKDIDPSFLS